MKRIIKLLLTLSVMLVLVGCSQNEETITCEISIDCKSMLEYDGTVAESAIKVLPEEGAILQKMTLEIAEGSSVYEALIKACREQGIMTDASVSATGDAYVKGIAGIYEKDAGPLSGWMFYVNGTFSTKGCSSVTVSDKDVIEWRYTCNMGEDLK